MFIGLTRLSNTALFDIKEYIILSRILKTSPWVFFERSFEARGQDGGGLTREHAAIENVILRHNNSGGNKGSRAFIIVTADANIARNDIDPSRRRTR